MKFLIDVNASRAIGQWLAALGHDAILVRDRNPQMRDEDILNWAVQEKRIIITTDNDFEQMIWQQGKSHCGIIRLENLPREKRKVLLEDVLKEYSQELEEGAIVIATQTKFRIRKPLFE